MTLIQLKQETEIIAEGKLEWCGYKKCEITESMINCIARTIYNNFLAFLIMDEVEVQNIELEHYWKMYLRLTN